MDEVEWPLGSAGLKPLAIPPFRAKALGLSGTSAASGSVSSQPSAHQSHSLPRDHECIGLWELKPTLPQWACSIPPLARSRRVSSLSKGYRGAWMHSDQTVSFLGDTRRAWKNGALE